MTERMAMLKAREEELLDARDKLANELEALDARLLAVRVQVYEEFVKMASERAK